MLTVTSWLWGSKYTRAHWRVLQRMFSAHCTVPHRFRLITDSCEDPDDIDERLVAHTVRWTPPRSGCLRRLAMLSPDIKQILGERFLHIDLDTVIVRNIDYMITEDDFRITRCSSRGSAGYTYGPGVMLMRAGVLENIWRHVRANPASWAARHRAMGWRGTDQAVMAPFLDNMEVPVWSQEDGVFSYRDEIPHDTGELPTGASVIQLYGPHDPMTMDWPWVRENYLCHL